MNQLAFNFDAQIEQAPVIDEWRTPIIPAGQPRDVSRQIARIIERNYQYFGDWHRAFEQSLDVMYLALTNKEQEYLDTVRSMDKRTVSATAEIFGLLINAFCVDYDIWDYLGAVYMELGSLSKHQAFGQFFTPMPICEMNAAMMLGDVHAAIETARAENRRLTVCDPACGSGAMLLGAKRHIIKTAGLDGLSAYEFYGNDIDAVCVTMSRIQMTLTSYRYMTSWLTVKACEIQRALQGTA